ncbi:MAG: 23S rRNA pseudouridylate synthase B [Gammaproteobacteria bacterium]|nr:23S rRNA pseudouridylate synthase B [Gammaproteobacteria bacterium]
MRRTGGRARAPVHEPERLQKVLARAGIASRREAEAWIRAGRLTINGAIATLGARVAPGDEVGLDGRPVRLRAPPVAEAFLCHRSPGEPLNEPAAQRAAMSNRLPRRVGRRLIAVSPMPRADGGLELLTSDGELAARLQRDVRALSSEFGVRVRGELSDAQLQGILAGELDSGARLGIERCEASGGEGANRWYRVVLRGASGRELRQLLERQGAQVSRVLRTRLGPLTLERSLGRGKFRALTQEELRTLLAGEPETAGPEPDGPADAD